MRFFLCLSLFIAAATAAGYGPSVPLTPIKPAVLPIAPVVNKHVVAKPVPALSPGLSGSRYSRDVSHLPEAGQYAPVTKVGVPIQQVRKDLPPKTPTYG